MSEPAQQPPTPTEMPRPQRPRTRVTARAMVLHEAHVLLLEANDPGRPWLYLPGGGVEHGETLADACRREVFEETGLHVTVERPLYLREFVAARHNRRSIFMPPDNHAVALIFLCHLQVARYQGLPLTQIGEFPGDVDGSGAAVGMGWYPVGQPLPFETMPPHIGRVIAGGDFPPSKDRGIEHWPEDDEGGAR